MVYTTRTIHPKDRLGASQGSRTRGRHEREEGKQSHAEMLANFAPRETFKAPLEVANDEQRADRGRRIKKLAPYVALAAIASLGIYETAGAASSEESSAAHQAAPIVKHLNEHPPIPSTQP